MTRTEWAAVLGASVPVLLTLGAILGRTITLVGEHELRLKDLDASRELLIQEVMTSREADSSLGQRISKIEGRMRGAVETLGTSQPCTPQHTIVTPIPVPSQDYRIPKGALREE